MGVLYVSGEGTAYSIGRDPGNDMVLDGTFVSRRHLRLLFVTEDVAIAEVLGMNGAVIGGRQVNKGDRCLTGAGERIRIGSYDIVWTGKPLRKSTGFIRTHNEYDIPGTEAVEIEGPPARRIPEKPSVMLAAGPALTMAVPILLGAGRTIAILSSVFAAAWAAFNVIARIRRQRSEERRRRNAYISYLRLCEDTIRERIEKVREALAGLYPPVGDYFTDTGDTCVPWSRSCKDRTLSVRIGIGQVENPVNIEIPKERFAAVDDSLKEMPQLLRKKYESIQAAPVIMELTGKSIPAFDVSGTRGYMILSSAILQLAVTYSPDEMVISVKMTDEMKRGFIWVTFLPHYRDPVEQLPEDGTLTILVTDNKNTAYESLSENVRVILAISSGHEVPGGIFDLISGKRQCKCAKPDMIPDKLCASYARSLSRMWGMGGKSEEIPVTVSFGELLSGSCFEGSVPGREKVAEWICENYRRSDITCRFDAPIGTGAGGRKVFLDLHEKAHGPHGLIAGTTGSGKSELLTTMILSFAVRFSPERLGFFLIDYKGGGMSNLFGRLPHLLGSISNLSASESRRAMIALKSENIRRQELFARVGVNNINDYTRLYDAGITEEPLPHILIIVDEFAELRKEEPEFMDRLVSVSQVGRSLGMHLILATQKPAGVVDEKIRGNSRFRIALRLVDRSDSTDMLQRPDAAFIRECGRAYLQVGNNEVFECFQSGYAMGPAISSEKSSMTIYEDMLLARRVEFAYEEKEGEQGKDRKIDATLTWYDLIMNCLIRASDLANARKCRKLWLPSLPDDAYDDHAFVLFDNPYMQRYEPAMYDPDITGSVLIAGRSGTGKSELLYTMLCRTAGLYAVYIIDNGGGRLEPMAKLPFCGGYICEEQPDDIERMTGFIREMMTARRRGAQISDVIILVLDDQTKTLRASPEAAQHIKDILTVGKSVGIFVLATCMSVSEAKLSDLYDTRLCLGSGDIYEIAHFLKIASRDIPAVRDAPGRGIGLADGIPLEFQAVKIREGGKPPPGNLIARKYPVVPAKPTLEDLLERALEEKRWEEKMPGGGRRCRSIPAGYDIKSGKLYMLPLEGLRCILVSGKPYSGRHTFLFNISITAAKYGIECVQADTYEALRSLCEDSTDLRIITVPNLAGVLNGFYEKVRTSEEENELVSYMTNPRGNTTGDIFHPVVIGILENDAAIKFAGRKIYESMIEHPYAVSFGGSLDENRIFDFSYLPFSLMHEVKGRCMGTVIKYDEKLYSGDIIIPGMINVDNSQSI